MPHANRCEERHLNCKSSQRCHHNHVLMICAATVNHYKILMNNGASTPKCLPLWSSITHTTIQAFVDTNKALAKGLRAEKHRPKD